MRRRLLATLLVAVAACRQIAGLEDRPTLLDAGTSPPDVVPPVDAAVDPTFCATADAAFCDDFEGVDAGWERDVTDDQGPPGELLVGDGGLDSARALHVVSVANENTGFRNNRLGHPFTPATQVIELSFAIFVPTPDLPDGTYYQLALLEVLGTAFYPTLARGALTFSWEAPTSASSVLGRPSTAGLAFDAWHRLAMTIDLAKRTVHATIDGADAVPEETYVPANVGAYSARIGLRTQGRTVPLLVRYDDVTVRFR